MAVTTIKLANFELRGKLTDISAQLLTQAQGITSAVSRRSVSISVKKPYLTKYLALEYGVAGNARAEKKKFSETGRVAKSITIPKAWNHLRYRIAKGPFKNTPYMRILGLRPDAANGFMRNIYLLPDPSWKIRRKGVPPANSGKGLFRGRKGKFTEMFVRQFRMVLQEVYGSTKRKTIAAAISDDKRLEQAFKNRMNLFINAIYGYLQDVTPDQTMSSERKDQIIRWNANMSKDGEPAYRKIPLGDLKYDGYVVKYIK